ncbi:hypothetical protein KR51_00001200 [Rubidibacter lacunae KORDI 51-2]|uniref:Uncharacterized protein n=1 Tax=Rubidibacter lacunae KORDI 51-2 TaxID=582515 RepID=U5DN88_9CHRO|nr:hypothetical protein [Rubidibacter lacunae]ERN43111.1 hypothetical protein KR51_00001200 [Rubidibacter lacunae KORDI 51-2]
MFASTKSIIGNSYNYILSGNNKVVYGLITLIGVVFLIARNPSPFFFFDIWAEDGKYYLASAFKNDAASFLSSYFWADVFHNCWNQKGYFQFAKFLVSQFSVSIYLFLGCEDLVRIPQIIALVSNLIYSMIFALPVLLFDKFYARGWLLAIVGINFLVDIGDNDFITFGRILQLGFLSIYLAFLLSIYRFVRRDSNLGWQAWVIDLLLLVCTITQPVNLIFCVFLISARLYSILSKGGLFTWRISNWSLTLLGVCNLVYAVVLVFFVPSEEIAPDEARRPIIEVPLLRIIKVFLGKLFFNQELAWLHNRIPAILFVFLFLSFLYLLSRANRSWLYLSLFFWFSTSSLVVLWRPNVLLHFIKEPVIVYAMPSNLIAVFLQISCIAIISASQDRLRFPKLIYWQYFVKILICLMVVVGLESSLTLTSEHFGYGSRISIREGIAIAKSEGRVDKEGRLQVPINPPKWTMWVPLRYIP